MPKFKEDVFKTHLKMAQIRMTQSNQKRHNLNQASRRDIAQLISRKEYSRAEIRTESVVRETYIMEAYEILIDLLELCVGRVSLIVREKICPPALVMHISTILWASNYVEISDFSLIRQDLEAKYGKVFVQEALSNSMGQANAKVVARLSCMVPDRASTLRHIQEICEMYDLDFQPEWFMDSIVVGAGMLPAIPHMPPGGLPPPPSGPPPTQRSGGGGMPPPPPPPPPPPSSPGSGGGSGSRSVNDYMIPDLPTPGPIMPHFPTPPGAAGSGPPMGPGGGYPSMPTSQPGASQTTPETDADLQGIYDRLRDL